MAAGLLLALAACSESDPTAVTPTYHGATRAIVEQRCGSCHVSGGVAPFALDDYEDVKTFASAALTSIETGRMPPWSPDPDCNNYEGERVMPADEIAVFRAWIEGGTLEGDPADYTPPAQKAQGLTMAALGPPTLELAPPEAYVPDPARPDDYRCFPLAQTFEVETYLRTTRVVPDHDELVHHVIVYLVPEQFVDLVEALDAEEAGPGYTCFGGVGAGQPTPIAGWTPGDSQAVGSPEAAIRIPAGSRLVMQMHYNTLTATPQPDQSTVQLWLLDEQPPYLLLPRFFPHIGIDIAAGDGASKHVRTFTNTTDKAWTVAATSPHMHLLGKRLRTVRENADGSETCLVDIPDWDFNWQQAYVLPEAEQMVVQPGEALRLECTYDNSEANQPVINGERLTPRRVTWGEGTLDEMCLNVIVLLEPYAPVPEVGDVCADFQPCYDQCRTTSFPMTGCILRCGGESGCAGCVLPGLLGELSEECGVQGNEVVACLESCATAEDGESCITNMCGISIIAFDQCAGPYVAAGDVDRPAAACGVEL